MKNVLVTGGAGFIGSHLVTRLLGDGCSVTVIDNFDPFYSPSVKEINIAAHIRHPAYKLVRADIRDMHALRRHALGEYDVIVHLAARAGVRPSIADPIGYQETNVQGTQNMLELARELGVRQFVFASSSSVYGVNPRLPWEESDTVLLPISPYASTKASGELLGHTYSHLFGIRFVALRFFTVYGPAQRPDLAIHKFARLIRQEEPLSLFGDGSTSRDYTYIDDIVAGIVAAMKYSQTPFEVVNLGNDRTVTLMQLIRSLEHLLGREATLVHFPEQPGDVRHTWADISKAKRLLNYAPKTPLLQGLANFLSWLEQTEGVAPVSTRGAVNSGARA